MTRISTKVPVIIPARNEEATIGPIVRTFVSHSEISGVVVAIDAETTDNTAKEAERSGAHIVYSERTGKGEVVVDGLRGFKYHRVDRLILCDGDYTGLTTQHIDFLIRINTGMTIGIPEWPDCPVPIDVLRAWPHVSGLRFVPRAIIPINAKGYLLETQMNLLAIKYYIPRYFAYMEGLKARFTWPLPKRRHEELLRDRRWGEMMGIL